MKHLWIVSSLLIPGCALLPYPFDQWEYPSPFLEAKVERTMPAARLTVTEFRARSKALEGQIIEVSGTILKIYNKGGCAGASLDGGAFCVFGRKQKPMVRRLRVGERVTFRGIVKPTYHDPWMEPSIRVPEVVGG